MVAPTLRMSAIRASLSRTPTASGLMPPPSILTGPWPRKTIRPVPAKRSFSKLTLPSMVTKSPMLRVASEMVSEKTACAEAANFTARVRPLSSTEVSIAVLRMVLIRSSTVPEASIGPAERLALPEMKPATPPARMTSRPAPSVSS